MKRNRVPLHHNGEQRAPSFGRAIVIGGGISGLTMARVLADHVAQVIVVERDHPADETGVRPGVPQAHHPHNLHPQGQRILEGLFPGLTEELLAEKAVNMGGPGDVAFYFAGAWRLARPGGRQPAVAASRGLLERVLYRRIQAHERIELMAGYEIAGLYPNATGDRVGGVRVRPRGGAAAGEIQLGADLVVDASGRRSRAPEWLQALGFPMPEEWRIDAQVGYSSRVYQRPADFNASWKMLYIRPTPPESTRGGIITPLEGDRWHVALIGVGGDYPPVKEEDFLAYAQTLPASDLYEALKDAQPLGRLHGFRRADNRVRRYDRLPRYLEGFFVAGDAAYALNPIYAQGMTAAVLGAEALATVLAEHASEAGIRGLSCAFQERLSDAVEGPWRLATRTDWHWPLTEVMDNTEGLVGFGD
jgi:2-polyprenyl-6-methoxyphenol hydroxylase-like FAD-dependent oxidoreductase